MTAMLFSPAVWFARIAGVVLTVLGIWALVITTDQNSVHTLFGMDINLTHGIAFLVSGVIGLVAGFLTLSSARTYALVIGVIYIAVAAWGFTDSNPLGIFGPADVGLNNVDNIFNLVVGVLGLGAYTLAVDAAEERIPN